MKQSLTKSLAAFIAIGIYGTFTSAQQPKLEDPPWLKDVAGARIVYSVPEMEKIKPIKDRTYKQTGAADLKLDVYVPPRLPRRARRPAIVFIHGGALPPNLMTKPKEWEVYVSFAQLAAASGFVGVTFNQRFYGWDVESLRRARQDVIDSIAYIRQHAAEFSIDGEQIHIWTVSAGSVLVSSLLTDDAPHIKSVIFYYPILDLEPMRRQRPAINDVAVAEFSVVRQLEQATVVKPPIFMARAGREEPALNEAVDRFVKLALAKKAALDLSNHPNGQHAFDVLDNDDRSREIIKRTLEFIKAH